jgi:hypothetical protein
MAIGSIQLDEAKERARRYKQSLRNIRKEFSLLEADFLNMAQDKDSAGNDPEHFALIADLYGTNGVDAAAKNANAKRLFDETNSAINNSAALLQLMAIMGA